MSDRIITLLRHGEVQGGARFRGAQDDPLSAAGWARMRAVAAREPDLTRIISSPSRRCAAFARDLAAARGLPVELAAGWGERHFGDWEGLTAADIPAADLTRFWEDPVGYTPPGAETFTDFRRRVLAAWQALLQGRDPRPLVVTHGGVLRVILAQVLGMEDHAGLLIEVPDTCVTRLRVPASPGRPSLMAHAAAVD